MRLSYPQRIGRNEMGRDEIGRYEIELTCYRLQVILTTCNPTSTKQ